MELTSPHSDVKWVPVRV